LIAPSILYSDTSSMQEKSISFSALKRTIFWVSLTAELIFNNDYNSRVDSWLVCWLSPTSRFLMRLIKKPRKMAPPMSTKIQLNWRAKPLFAIVKLLFIFLFSCFFLNMKSPKKELKALTCKPASLVQSKFYFRGR